MRKTTKLMNEIKELHKWIDILCSWIERLNTVKINCFQLIYRFSIIPAKIPVSYFVHINKLILKFI